MPPRVVLVPPEPTPPPAVLALPRVALVCAGAWLVTWLVFDLSRVLLAVGTAVAAFVAFAEIRFVVARRQAASAAQAVREHDAFLRDVERALAQEAADLARDFTPGRVGRSSGGRSPRVILGHGSVQSRVSVVNTSPSDERTAQQLGGEVPAGPLVVEVAGRLDVLGPPRLAAMLARGYAAQIQSAGVACRVTPAFPNPRHAAPLPVEPAAAPVSVVIEGAPRGDVADAQVWLGPAGDVYARSPDQADGRWVPLDPSFDVPLCSDEQPRARSVC